MADVQIRAYREQYGLNYTSIIPSNIYGPNDNFSFRPWARNAYVNS
jgi:GDP-L-fucose synthase